MSQKLFDCAAVVANLKLCCLATLTDWSSVAWQPLPTQTVLTPPQKFLLNSLQLADKRAQQTHVSLAIGLQHCQHLHTTQHFTSNAQTFKKISIIHTFICVV